MIRSVELKDIDRIIYLEETYLGESIGKKLLTESITTPHQHFYTIEEDLVIGYIGACILAGETEVLNFVIDEAYQRKGYGQTLLNKIIEEFVTTMRNNFDDETLKNLYDNIKWVLFKKFKVKGTNGEYLSATNVIRIVNEGSVGTINHELLHMSANPYDDTNNFGGFFYTIDKYKIGYGLDEGYTELLNKRYFGSRSDNIYETEVIFCKFLEEIVGQKKMEKMYLTANLFGLIQDLKQIYDVKEIERFMAALDFINDYNYRSMISDIEITNLYEQVELAILFIFKGYCGRLTDKTMPEDLIEMDTSNYLETLFGELEFEPDEKLINKINLIIQEKLNKNVKLNINRFKVTKNVL